MIRKHFKLRRIVLGFAFAALVAPAAYATPYGGAPTSEIQSGTTSEISVQPTASALQAEGMRWQAMGDAYLSPMVSIGLMRAWAQESCSE
jgi:hypothetical protein